MRRITPILLSSLIALSACSTSAAPVPSSTDRVVTTPSAANEVCLDTYAFSKLSEITESHIDKFRYSTKPVSSPTKLNLVRGENLISKPGAYLVKGEYSETWIRINSTGNGTVKLVFDGLKIVNIANPAIWIENSAQTEISLSPDSSNTLISSSDFSETATDQHAVTAHGNLLITGNGNLIIVSENYDAINSSDGVIIDAANISAEAGDDAIVGSEYVLIQNSQIRVDAGDDGIRTTNQSGNNLGLLEIYESNLTINSRDEGLQSRTDLIVQNSTVRISSLGHGIRSRCRIGLDANIEIGTDLVGVKADNALSIFGGKILITKSYEGLESMANRIFGGDIEINSQDDGISTRIPDGYRDYNLRQAERFDFVMSGGKVHITAGADSVDSNGNILINGGKLVATSGVTNAETAIDSESFFYNDGGEIWGFSSSNEQFPANEKSMNASLVFYLDETFPVNSTVEVRSNSKIISSENPSAAFATVLYSGSNLAVGQDYELWINNRLIKKVEAGSERGKQPGYGSVQR